jgi:hypothetical protein
MRCKPYLPRDLGELLDYPAHMMLSSPKFKDKSGYFPRENFDTAFLGLNEGLPIIRKNLGEGRYAALKAMSNKMRVLFESDPDDKTGDTRAGHMLINKMEDILTDVARREASK